MSLITIIGLSLFSWRGRPTSPTDDLDAVLAEAQSGLEKKRQRWLVFLLEREEQCKERLALTPKWGDEYDKIHNIQEEVARPSDNANR